MIVNAHKTGGAEEGNYAAEGDPCLRFRIRDINHVESERGLEVGAYNGGESVEEEPG